MATRLSQNGCRVTGIDISKERVEELKDVLYEAVIGNATELDTLKQLSLQDASAVMISLGEDIARSLLATLHVRDSGAKRIIVKGVSPEHEKLLKSLGVERVIFPEAEIAAELADRMSRPNVIDFLPIDPEYSFMEIVVPDQFAGKSLMDLDFRRRFGVWIVGIKDAMTGKLQMFPNGDCKLAADQMMLVVGKQTDMDGLLKE